METTKSRRVAATRHICYRDKSVASAGMKEETSFFIVIWVLIRNMELDVGVPLV